VQGRPARNITFLVLALLGFLAWSTTARTFRRPATSLILAGASPAVASTPGLNDYSPALCRHDADARALEAAGEAVFHLETEVLFDTGDEEPARVMVEGTGTILFGRYVLTVAHAVTQNRIETSVRTPRGDLMVPLNGKQLSSRTWLIQGGKRVALQLLVADETADVALLQLPEEGTWPRFPYSVGDSDDLELGDFVALIERDPVAGTLYRPGAVAALRGPAAIAPIARTEGAFLVSFGLTSGESGAPIVATRAGAYQLVGLAQGTYQGPRQLAWAVRMSRALHALERSGGPEVRAFLALCGRLPQSAGTQPGPAAPPQGQPPSHEAGARGRIADSVP